MFYILFQVSICQIRPRVELQNLLTTPRFRAKEIVIRQGLEFRQAQDLIETMRLHIEQNMPGFHAVTDQYIQTIYPQ